jgi:hypothetical protein
MGADKGGMGMTADVTVVVLILIIQYHCIVSREILGNDRILI